MFNKINISLSIIILLSTSAAFSMHKGDEYKERMRKKLQTRQYSTQQQIQYTPEQEVKFNTILSLYEEQAEHHKYMRDTITKYKKDPLDNFWNIFGVSADRALVTGGYGVPVEDVIDKIIEMHVVNSNIYERLSISRKATFANKECSLFAQLAELYHGAIANSNDAADEVGRLKQQYTEEEFKNLYLVKLMKEKIALYKRVQKAILEEFDLNKDEIFSELFKQSEINLKDYLNLTRPFMSSKTRSFCHDVVKKRYQFPSLESFSDLTLSAEAGEEKRVDIIPIPMKKDTASSNKRKPKKKLATINTPKSIKSTADFQTTESALPLQVKEQVEKTNLLQPAISSMEEKKSPNGHAELGELELAGHNDTNALESVDGTVATPKSIKSTADFQTTESVLLLQVREQEETTNLLPSAISSMEEKKSSNDHAEIVKERRLEAALAQLELDEFKLAKHNYIMQALESGEDSSYDFKAVYAEDHKKKKEVSQKIATSLVPGLDETEVLELGLNEKKLVFLSKIFSHPINLNLRWDRIVSLFNGPSGFKGMVYGTKNGSANTFEVYLKFQKGKLAGFLFEKEFLALKKNAQPELLKDRKFLPDNKRLQSYKVSPNLSIAKSFFTLHNPHPNSCAYEALVERLQGQLCLLGITPETIKGLNF